jgi:transposase
LLKVLAFDEARFGLINWHRRRYCPKGFHPPYVAYVVRRSYKWTYLLYAAVEPTTTGESFCLYLPGMDDGCLEVFLAELSKTYADHHLLIVLDGAPSHRSEQITHPENVSLLMLPPYSPELDPAERWFQEFRRKLSNKAFENVALYCKRRSRRRRWSPTGKSPSSSNGSPVTLGGWRRWRRYDINSPERYNGGLLEVETSSG